MTTKSPVVERSVGFSVPAKPSVLRPALPTFNKGRRRTSLSRNPFRPPSLRAGSTCVAHRGQSGMVLRRVCGPRIGGAEWTGRSTPLARLQGGSASRRRRTPAASHGCSFSSFSRSSFRTRKIPLPLCVARFHASEFLYAARLAPPSLPETPTRRNGVMLEDADRRLLAGKRDYCGHCPKSSKPSPSRYLDPCAMLPTRSPNALSR
jgi:hypothetical protein